MMGFFLGIDGGNTKTRCVIGDESGAILADQLAGPSNHQSLGAQRVQDTLECLIRASLEEAEIPISDLNGAYLGLAGADLPSDFELLRTVCDSLFSGIPYQIDNDAWIIMRSGLQKDWGAVCICGAGSNSAACNEKGDRAILRSLSHTLGGCGGGMEMAREALHRAFRHDEQTGPFTMLAERIPHLFSVPDMASVIGFFSPEQQPTAYETMKKIPPLVFELANQHDTVCQEILIQMGLALGEMASGPIRKVKIMEESFTVVLGGSVFLGSSPLLIDSFSLSLRRTAPRAEVFVARMPPVIGAFLSALDHFGPIPSEPIYLKLEERYR